METVYPSTGWNNTANNMDTFESRENVKSVWVRKTTGRPALMITMGNRRSRDDDDDDDDVPGRIATRPEPVGPRRLRARSRHARRMRSAVRRRGPSKCVGNVQTCSWTECTFFISRRDPGRTDLEF